MVAFEPGLVPCLFSLLALILPVLFSFDSKVVTLLLSFESKVVTIMFSFDAFVLSAFFIPNDDPCDDPTGNERPSDFSRCVPLFCFRYESKCGTCAADESDQKPEADADCAVLSFTIGRR